MRSSFGEILQRTVKDTPGAIGGALAAGDGETVDYWTQWEEDDWNLLTAHFGIIVNYVRRSLHTFHFGDIDFIHIGYKNLDLAVQLVEGDYYVILAMMPPVRLAPARRTLGFAAKLLRQEML
jgi:hypothetical protein